MPRFYGADALAAWRKVAGAVHAEGAAIFPQLWHIGAQRKPGTPPFPDAPVVSPSGLDPAGRTIGEPASARTLADITASFARAAADARAAGFDGVELHGAHGYLLDQFHWPATNRRDDDYGGEITGRVRFSAQVAAAVRAAVGPDFPVAFRFSQWKGGHYDARIAETPHELAAFLSPLVNAGITLFHVSTRRYWRPAFDGSDRTLAGLDQAPHGSARHRHRLGRRLRAVLGQPRRGRAALTHPRAARRPAPPRRVQPSRPRPRRAGRPGVGPQASPSPAGRNPPVRQIGRLGPLLTPRQRGQAGCAAAHRVRRLSRAWPHGAALAGRDRQGYQISYFRI